MLIMDHVGWAPLQQELIMYWRIHDLWGPANLVASTVTELYMGEVCSLRPDIEMGTTLWLC
jgi:hypothetical protein